MASEWMQMPDSAGWWAYEDGADKFVAHLQIFDRNNDEVTFKFDNSSKDTVDEENFLLMYPGKWWKVQLPWATE